MNKYACKHIQICESQTHEFLRVSHNIKNYSNNQVYEFRFNSPCFIFLLHQ